MSGQESNLRLSMFRRLIDDRARNLGPVANRGACLARPLIAAIITAALAGCGTTALKPEPKLVSSVTSLPPVQVPVPVRCVKEIPPIPPVTIDPNAPVLARYYQMKADLLALDDYKIKANAALLACAVEEPK